MNALKNVKWVVLLTFVLGYVVSTVDCDSELKATTTRMRPDSLPPAEAFVAETVPSRWTVVDVDSSLPAYFSEHRPNVINRSAALNKAFNVLCNSGRPLRVLHLGDSHVAGGDFPQAVRATLVAAWGAASDTASAGIFYRYIGKNGAIAKHFATPERMRQVSEVNPDLIIVSFGTNECHGMGYREALHATQLQEFYDQLVMTCPEAVVLLTTPPGDYLAKRTVRYVRRGRNRKRRRVVRTVSQVNPMTVRCAAEIERFAAEKELPVWDLNTLAGGADAVRNWGAGHLMRPDRIHFTPEGYTLQGHLLGEAILVAYNDYIRN